VRCLPGGSPAWRRPRACVRPRRRCAAEDNTVASPHVEPDAVQPFRRAEFGTGDVHVVVPNEPALPGRLIDQENNCHQGGGEEPVVSPRWLRQNGATIGLGGGRLRLAAATRRHSVLAFSLAHRSCCAMAAWLAQEVVVAFPKRRPGFEEDNLAWMDFARVCLFCWVASSKALRAASTASGKRPTRHRRRPGCRGSPAPVPRKGAPRVGQLNRLGAVADRGVGASRQNPRQLVHDDNVAWLDRTASRHWRTASVTFPWRLRIAPRL